MVSIPTLAGLVFVTLVVAAMPVVLYRKLRTRFALVPREPILGIAVFALFAMVIERALHGFVLGNAVTSHWLSNPVVFVVYGALAAGVCEEAGRFAGMKWLIRREPGALERHGPALGYGIGHGGRKPGSSARWCRRSGSCMQSSRITARSTPISKARRSTPSRAFT